MLRIALLVALVAGVAPRPAAACPPGPCNKYKQPPHPLMQARAVGYTRRIIAKMPRLTRSRIVSVLTGSIWDPVFAGSPHPNVRVIAPKSIRFVDARTVTRAPVRGDIRTVLIRRIDVRDGQAMVEIDGQVFVLERCDFHLPDVCMNLRDDLSFDEPAEDTEFAKPPR